MSGEKGQVRSEVCAELSQTETWAGELDRRLSATDGTKRGREWV